MIDKGRHASAPERKVIAETHIRKHLHLTSSLHLKHHLHMEGASSVKVDTSSSSQPSSEIKEVLMQTLATLQKSSVFNDPPMSPSCKNSRTDAVLRGCGTSAVSGREAGVEIGSFSVSKDVPFLTHNTKNYPKQRSRRGTGAPLQIERKFRGKRTTRLKLFSTKLNKGARSTGLSAGSCSLQSSKCLPSTKRGVALPSAKERHVDIGGLPETECTSLWNQSRVQSKGEEATQVSEFRENNRIELGLAEKSLKITGIKPTTNVDSLHTSCSQPLPALGPSTSFCENSSVKPPTNLHSLCSQPLPLWPSALPSGWITSEHMSSNAGVHSECHVSKNEDLDIPCSLSVKYAPKSFHDILGQHLVTQALSNALSRGRVAPMYIFYGPRGTGKTSCTKLFALALNCLSIGNDRPCGYCRLCIAQICGKFSPVKEVKTGCAYGVKDITSLMKDISWSSSFLYKVCHVDDCQALSIQAWNTLLKGMKEASKRTVFIFNTVSLEHIPHAVASRCQKYHFSKIKERDIINKLQMIALQENLDADIEAIELIASACNGSLYDAELMLDHISLLGDKVRVPVVQDLVGLISDSSLMELLDSALSADITNTVQRLKAFFESGVEPLNLISQLASLITRILAGGYHAPKRKHKSKFFRRKELTKDNMQILRQALRILSETEKQVRGSPGGMTWLIAALLQFAPDRSYIASSCPSADTSLTHRTVGRSTRDTPKRSKYLSKIEEKTASHSQSRARSSMNKATSNARESPKTSTLDASFHHLKVAPSPKVPARSKDMPWFEAATATTHLDNHADIIRKQTRTERDDLEQVWQRVLDAVNSTNLKCFLRTQGKLVSLSFHKDSKEAILEFHHLEHVSRVQRSKASILHAFQATLGHRIKVKVRLVPRANERRTKQGNWKQEEAKLDLLQQATLMSGSGTSNSKLTNEGSTGDTHEEAETRETHQACEPQMVYETDPRFVIDSQRNRSNESIGGGKLPNSSEHMLHDDTYKHVWPNRAMQVEGPFRAEKNRWRSLDNGISLDYVSEQAEGTIEGYSLDLQFNHAHTTSRQDSTGYRMCANSETGRSLALVAAKLEEENLRMESTSKENECWKTTNNACKAVACSKHSKHFLSFFPCASIPK